MWYSLSPEDLNVTECFNPENPNCYKALDAQVLCDGDYEVSPSFGDISAHRMKELLMEIFNNNHKDKNKKLDEKDQRIPQNQVWLRIVLSLLLLLCCCTLCYIL